MEPYERSKTCCLTGHRTIRIKDRDQIESKIDHHIHLLVQVGVNCFVSGGVNGFDRLAGSRVVEAKKRHPSIRLVLILPCPYQHARSPAQQALYDDFRSSADEIRYIAQYYTDGCVKERNRQLLKMCGICLAYLRNNASGTGQTVRLARKAGLIVIAL